jgi:formate dehydrogenase major subunit/NADH-quinone oxidoreductase subunit G
MKTVSFTIDGKKLTARAGTTVLRAARENSVYIPSLCDIGDREPEASCRLCFVAIEGRKEPVTACTETVAEGMVINTRDEKVLGLVHAGFELIMASHPADCARCAADRACELQKIAKHLGCSLKPKNLRKLLRELPIDASNPVFTYDPNKCVACGRCVWVCRRHGQTVLGMAHRGFKRRSTTFADEPIGARCLECGGCVKVCPAGALALKK